MSDRPISVHEAGLGGFFRSQMGPLLLLGFCGILFGCSFLPSKEGPAVAFWMGVGSVVGAVACLAWAILAYSRLIKRVALYPDRVEWGDQIATWADITEVWRTEIIVNDKMQTRQVVIKTHDGVEATFMYILGRWAEMAERIQAETAKVLGPPAFAAYDAGRAVKFGDLVVSPSGVKIAGKQFPWESIARTTIENGHYCVYKPGEEYSQHSMSLGSTPNMLVLLRLLERTPKPPFSGPSLTKRG